MAFSAGGDGGERPSWVSHPPPQSVESGRSNRSRCASAGARRRRRAAPSCGSLELYLVDPAIAGWRAISGRGKAGLDERKHTHAGIFAVLVAAAVNKGAATKAAPQARV